MIRKNINKFLKKFDLELHKVNQERKNWKEEFTMFSALERCLKRGIQINSVIDVGASDGCWTAKCLKLLPEANYLLIEAQEPHRKDLETLSKQNSLVSYTIAAAGHRGGSVFFDNTDLFGGLASDTPFGKNCIEIPVITIDNEVIKKNLKGPFLIKLDTHGYEVPILEGAKLTLSGAELVIIETYNFQIAKDSLRFFEMCSFMENLGFYPIEMADFMLRKYDNAFWQMDTFFIKKERNEFAYNSYE